MSDQWVLPLTFFVWKSWYQEMEIKARRQEVRRLRCELDRKYDSIHKMNKAALVGKAMSDLGWTRVDAERETCDQLRLYLKEHYQAERVQEENSEWGKPKGLHKMRVADLSDEAERRGISLPSGPNGHPTKQEFIRAILQHINTHHVPSIMSEVTSTRTATVPPWRNPEDTAGLAGPSTASSSGPPRTHRPLHVRHAARRARSLGATPYSHREGDAMECELNDWHAYQEDADL